MNGLEGTTEQGIARIEHLVEERQRDIEIALEGDYSAYLDGVLVDVSKIDINQYSVSVNHEKQEIYMSYKQPTSTTTRVHTVPIFFPMW